MLRGSANDGQKLRSAVQQEQHPAARVSETVSDSVVSPQHDRDSLLLRGESLSLCCACRWAVQRGQLHIKSTPLLCFYYSIPAERIRFRAFPSTKSAPPSVYNGRKNEEGMSVIVYVDVLIGINFMVNFVLLRLVAQFSGEIFPGWRAALGAFVGALSSLVIFWQELPAVWLPVLRMAFSLVMVALTFGIGDARVLRRRTVLLFLSSFLLSGVMLALSLLLRTNGMHVYRGVVYFDVGLPALIGSVIVAYLCAKLLSMMLWSRSPVSAQCTATIFTERGNCTVPALIDTGSSLIEPFSQNPVLVCDAQALGSVLPEGFFCDGVEPAPNFRLVPYRTLGGSGLLRAFRPLAVQIKTEHGVYCCRSVYVAVSQTPLGSGNTRAVLNPALLETCVREEAVLS
jgi:stage II sporulation protein GA (sporulation sigma-E factor processing peptidase)